MEIFFLTFEAVITIIGIGFLGFWILRRKLLPDDIIQTLTPLAIDIALPCLVFSNIMKSFNPAQHANWYQFPLWWVFFSAGVLVCTLVFSFVIKRKYRSEFRVGLMYHNGIFIPMGIIRGVYGQDSVYLADLFLFTFLFPAFFFNTYHVFFRKSDSAHQFSFNWKVLRNPILLATAISMALKLSGASAFVPGVVIKIASVVAEMALPLIILIIGGSIYLDLQKKERLRILEATVFVLVKNIIFPAIALGILWVIRPPFNIALIVVLSAAVPPITAFPIVTEKAGGSRGFANQMLTASFIAALVSVPAAMWVLYMIYSR